MFRAIPMLVAFALVALALWALPAAAATPDQNIVEWSGSWRLYSSDCTDDYNADVNGERPPGTGTKTVTVSTSWDAFNQRVQRLAENIGTGPQVSGDPDGFCDSDPGTILFNFTAPASEIYYLGPIYFPPGGMWVIREFGDVVTSYNFDLFAVNAVDRDAAPNILHTLISAENDTALAAFFLGPDSPDPNHSVLVDVEEFPMLRDYVYFNIDTAGAGTVSLDLVLIEGRGTKWSAKHRR